MGITCCRSLVRSFVRSFPRWFARSLVRPFVRCRSLARPFVRSFLFWFARSLARPFVHVRLLSVPTTTGWGTVAPGWSLVVLGPTSLVGTTFFSLVLAMLSSAANNNDMGLNHLGLIAIWLWRPLCGRLE